MPRASNAPARRRRRNSILKAAKGYYGSRSKRITTAADAVDRAKVSAYRDRKRKKTQFRRLWITRINAACRMRGINYSNFINGLSQTGVEINRKMLSEIAISDATTFDRLVKTATEAK